jgi:hypothetical protein
MMRNTSVIKRLQVSRDTLRVLSTDDLKQVQGGGPGTGTHTDTGSTVSNTRGTTEGAQTADGGRRHRSG